MTSFKEKMEALWRGEKPASQLGQWLGMEIVHFEQGSAFFMMIVSERHWSMLGIVQGGVLTTVAEAAMGVALSTILKDNESFALADLQVHFLRPIKIGRIDAKARLVERSRALALTECELLNESKKLIAKISARWVITRNEEKS